MSRLPRVVDVEHLGGYCLRLTFSDGLVREIDFEGILKGGVFQPLESIEGFAEVGLDDVAGTISWPNGVDLDPDVLHGDYPAANGKSPSVLREYRLRPTG